MSADSGVSTYSALLIPAYKPLILTLVQGAHAFLIINLTIVLRPKIKKIKAGIIIVSPKNFSNLTLLEYSFFAVIQFKTFLRPLFQK